jgi:hypothetical protein
MSNTAIAIVQNLRTVARFPLVAEAIETVRPSKQNTGNQARTIAGVVFTYRQAWPLCAVRRPSWQTKAPVPPLDRPTNAAPSMPPGRLW